MKKKTTVITGIGPVTPIGIGASAFWESCITGFLGTGPISQSNNGNASRLHVGGVIDPFIPTDFLPKANFKWMDRVAQVAVVGAKMAIEDAGIDLNKEDPRKIGVMFGTCLGGMLVAEEQLEILSTKGPKRVRPKLVPANTLNSAASETAIAFGLKGPNITVSTFNICGAESMLLADHAFQLYDLDVMLVGGADASLGNLTMKSMPGVDPITKTSMKPFDLSRDGFVPSEGGAVLIMERLEHAIQRKAYIYAEYAGCAQARSLNLSIDEALIRASKQALQFSSLDTNAVDYIHAFGAATPKGDKLETEAIKKTYGKRAYKIPTSSIKSMVGHTFGGSAAIEIAACAMVIKKNMVPPTINLNTRDPFCDLDYVPNQARKLDVRVALAHTVSLTGNSMVTVLKKYEE